jgi:hypothetical protein
LTTRRDFLTALLLVGFTPPAWGAEGASGPLAKASTDLKQIGLALHNYEATFRSFPPAYLVDPNGTPTLSWRVLILPYLEEFQLYLQFDLTKPWNDPVNLPLLAQMPEIYRGPSPGRKPIYTGYAGVAGPDQFFQGEDGVRQLQIGDGISNTMAVGPAGHKTLIPWTAPDDIDIEEHLVLGTPDGFDIAGRSSTPMLFADAEVRFVPNTTAPDIVLALSTIAGNEAVIPP